MTPDVQPTGISSNISHRPVAKVNCPPKKIEGKRVPEKIATEALRLMSRLMDDMTALDSQKKALAFLPEEESNLRKILELGEISLFNFVEDHLLEKMIMVIKVYDAFKVDCVANKEIVGLILEKYQQMKNLILQG